MTVFLALLDLEIRDEDDILTITVWFSLHNPVVFIVRSRRNKGGGNIDQVSPVLYFFLIAKNVN